MGSIRADLSRRVFLEPDHFERLPDSVILLILNKVGDVKALGRSCVVSRRFQSLVPQVENVIVRVDCVISDDDEESSAPSSSAAVPSGGADKLRHPISYLFRVLFSGLFKPLQSLSQLITSSPRRPALSEDCDSETEQASVTHHSPSQVLKNFNEIKFLRIELPSGELGIDDGVLLKWKANFGSTLDSCVILGSSSVVQKTNTDVDCMTNRILNNTDNGVENENGSIPESFYTNGGLKMRVVWTISSLIAASARHYLLQPIVAEHKTLEKLVLTDANVQGVLAMDREQLEELRVKPLSASSASKRTLVPALNMLLRYSPHLELPNGLILKGATLIAIRPSEHPKDVVGSEGNWVVPTFEEPFETAVRMLMKMRTYRLEMNSF